MFKKSALHPLSFILDVIMFRLKGIEEKTNKTDKILKKNGKIKATFYQIQTRKESKWEFTGSLKNNKPHGNCLIQSFTPGKFYGGNYSFNGEFIDGVANGKGEEKNLPYDLGSYIGDFKKNQRHGKGTFIFFNGSKYIGQWKNNFRNGKGLYTWPDGHSLEGKWSSDLYCKFDEVEPPFYQSVNMRDIKTYSDLKFTVTKEKNKNDLININPKLVKDGVNYKMISFDEIMLREEMKLPLDIYKI